MSTRFILNPDPVISNGDMSGNITSKVTILGGKTGCSYGLSWSGSSPVGTFAVQASNDYQLSPDGKTVVNAGTWTNFTFSVNGSPVSTIAISGNTGEAMLDVTKTQVYAVRGVYTSVSGTGTLQATIAGRVA